MKELSERDKYVLSAVEAWGMVLRDEDGANPAVTMRDVANLIRTLATQQSAANGAGDAVNFRGESLYEARRLLVNTLKAQKSWLTDYAEAFIDDFVRQTARAAQPAGAERGET